jgi:excisionase family DNA binding protein
MGQLHCNPLKKRDLTPKKSAFLSRVRYRIDTVFSQLTERYCVKRVWTRDLWHLASRLLRKVLSHTAAFLLNYQMGLPPLQTLEATHLKNLHIGLAMDKSWVYRRIHSGEIPSVKIGRSIKIRRSELERYPEEHTYRQTDEM